MAAGRYVFEDGRVEAFASQHGPWGWAYLGERNDGVRTEIAVDTRWRPTRVEITTPTWRVRGGSVGREVMWVRSGLDGTDAVEDSAEAAGFVADSPGFFVVTARLLALPAEGSAWLRLVTFDEPALSPMVVEARWTLLGVEQVDTDSGPLRVEGFRIDDGATGEHILHYVAGDIVLEAPGIHLDDLEEPPYQPV